MNPTQLEHLPVPVLAAMLAVAAAVIGASMAFMIVLIRREIGRMDRAVLDAAAADKALDKAVVDLRADLAAVLVKYVTVSAHGDSAARIYDRVNATREEHGTRLTILETRAGFAKPLKE